MTIRRTSGSARTPSAIDGWTGPGWRLLERHEVAVRAEPARALAAALDLPLTDLPLVLLLFRLRGLRVDPTMTLADFFATAPFLRLDEVPGQEAVYGVVARDGRPLRVAGPGAFRAAAAGAPLAAVVSFLAEPAPGGARLVTETWAASHGRAARLAFGLYWLAVGPFSALIRRLILAAARRSAEG
jgi:hypothetical protein